MKRNGHPTFHFAKHGAFMIFLYSKFIFKCIRTRLLSCDMATGYNTSEKALAIQLIKLKCDAFHGDGLFLLGCHWLHFLSKSNSLLNWIAPRYIVSTVMLHGYDVHGGTDQTVDLR